MNISIQQVGIINPPLIFKAGSKYRIACGRRRVYYALVNNLSSIEARIVNVSSPEGFILGLWENLTARTLNPVEKINALYGLKYICRLSWKKISQDFSSALGLPANISVLRSILLLKDAPERIKYLLSRQRLSYELATSLKIFKEEELKIFLDIIETLSLGRNKINDILDLYSMLRKRPGNRKRILKRIKNISLKNKDNPKQGFQEIKEFLYSLTHPQFLYTKRRLKSIMKELPCVEIKIGVPRDLEDKRISFQFDARSAKEFMVKTALLRGISLDKINKILEGI